MRNEKVQQISRARQDANRRDPYQRRKRPKRCDEPIRSADALEREYDNEDKCEGGGGERRLGADRFG